MDPQSVFSRETLETISTLEWRWGRPCYCHGWRIR